MTQLAKSFCPSFATLQISLNRLRIYCNLSINRSCFMQGIAGGGIIVHCAAGISRSTSCCLSYLLIKKRMSLSSAYKLVWDARENVRPNPGFWKQLRMLEKELVESGIVLDDSLRLADDMKDRKALQIIESLDSESRRVPAMGTSVSFSLQVEDAEEARAKLMMRHLPLDCRSFTSVFSHSQLGPSMHRSGDLFRTWKFCPRRH